MVRYWKMITVKLTPEAKEQALRLPKATRGRIRDALKRLENWPTVSGVKRLTGNLAGWYRMRVGDYRIRFRVASETIVVDKIGDRKDVYEG
jgi:mRNA interferase RelE/StbE